MLRTLFLTGWLAALLGQRPGAVKFINSFAGPYIAYPIAFPPCAEGSWNGSSYIRYRLLSHFSPARPRKLLAYEGEVFLDREFADSHWMRATVATRSNNQWKQNAFVFNFPVGGCSAFRANLPAMYEDWAGTSAWSRGRCAIPEGLRHIKGAGMNWTFPNVPVMPYGHWLFEAKAAHVGRAVAESCWRVEGKTIPRV